MMETVAQWFDALWLLTLDGADWLLGRLIILLDAITADHVEGAAVMALILLGPSLAMGLANGFWEGLRIEWRQLQGRPRVVDGDTIELRGERIRLFGIDAPELGQPWWDQDGREQDAGQSAMDALAILVEGRRLAVKVLREDKYQRSIAIVKVDGSDIARSLVSQGWAFASPGSSRYRRTENAARRRRRGFWQGEVMMPWDFRAAA
ncbi:MAG: thermonuclease family protein [Alphaproteobacteria bacterium]